MQLDECKTYSRMCENYIHAESMIYGEENWFNATNHVC